MLPVSFVTCSGKVVSVTFCVWLLKNDFRREWYDSTVVWVQIFYLFVIGGCYLVLTT